MSDLDMLATSPRWKLLAFSAVAALGIVVAYSQTRELDPWEQHLAAMEAQLEAAWHARHPGELPEACEGDEVHAGAMEIDPSPGRELVISSQRLGIAMFSEAGVVLATAEPTGCTPMRSRWINNVLSADEIDFPGLVLREETASGSHRCRTTTWATVFEREGDRLVRFARYREHDSDQCAWVANRGPSTSHWISSARSTPRGVRLRVEKHEDGRQTRYLTCSTSGAWIDGACAFLVEGGT